MAATLVTDVLNTSKVLGSLESPDEPPVESLLLYRLSNYLWYFGSPVILLLGNFGNVMTLVIMKRMTSGESVVNIYFTGLAIVDLIPLDVFLLSEWIGITSGFWIKSKNDVFCKIYTWISTAATTVSAWILVSLTVHRAISVVWPHRVNLMCTRRKVVVQLTVIATLFAGVYAYYLYGVTLVDPQIYDNNYCLMMPGNYVSYIDEIFTYFDLILYSLLPFVCLLFANGILVSKLRTSVKAAGKCGVAETRQKVARSVTTTVILVSMTFVILTLPSAIFQIIYYVTANTGRMSVDQIAESHLINTVALMLVFCNNAVNFYLYCLTGKRFREEFFHVVCCGGVKRSTGVCSESEGSSKQVPRRSNLHSDTNGH